MLDGAGGLKPCLSAWKSAKADSIRRGFHELSRRLQPRESRESWLAEQLQFMSKSCGFYASFTYSARL